MKKFIVLFLICNLMFFILVIFNCKKNKSALSYEGSSTIGEGVMPELSKVFKEKNGISFSKIGIAGSGTGFKSVMSGKADIGGLSRSLKNKEKNQNPYYQVIGYDAIAIFINDKNPINNLSKEQIKGIFTGQITNWRDVGGLNKKIEVVTEIKDGKRATIEVFKKVALGGADFGYTKEIDLPYNCVKYVKDNEYAITHASFSFNVAGTKFISVDNIVPSIESIRSGSYFLSRSLVIVSKDFPKGNKKRFFDFILSEEGQKIVNKKFISVR